MHGAVRQRDTNAVAIKHTSWRFRTWTAPRQLRIPFVPTMTKTSSTPSVPQSKFRISTITGGANVHRVFISSSIAEQRWSTNDARFSIQRHRRLRLSGRVAYGKPINFAGMKKICMFVASYMSNTREKCLNGKITPRSNRPAHDTSESIYSKFLIEKQAKNQAYGYILSQGLLRDYIAYSRGESCSLESVDERLEMVLKNF